MQHRPQGIDIAPGIHVSAAPGRLFRAHVGRSAQHLPGQSHQRALRQHPLGSPGNAEVDHLGLPFPADEDIRWLQIPVNDAPLVRME